MSEHSFVNLQMQFHFRTRHDGHEVVGITLYPRSGPGAFREVEVEEFYEAIQQILPEIEERVARKRAPLTPVEQRVLAKLCGASLRSGSGDKRFVRQVAQLDPQVGLTDRQRRYLAILAWRYRRQYAISAEEKQFICAHFPVPEPQRGAA